jgi:hypothetical protein
MESAAPKRLLIDTIDYETGRRVDRWEATQSNADATVKRYPLFRPMSGSFEEDLVRFAHLVQATGPWHTRGRQLGPPVAISPDGEYILYGARPDNGGDGDWLYLADRNGMRPRRVDTGVRASYAAVFSPDGSRIAWQGCTASPCGYALFVTKLGGAPERAQNLPESSPPVWSADGRFVYAVGRPSPTKTCLYKVAGASVRDTKMLRCLDGLRDVEFVQDPSSRTGVLTGSRGAPGQQVFEYTWLLLADGSVLGTHAIDRAAGSGLLSEAGLLTIPMQKGGLAVLDLVSGNAGAVVDAEGWFFGLETTKWVGDSVILLRRTGAPDSFELVAVDMREVSAKR